MSKGEKKSTRRGKVWGGSLCKQAEINKSNATWDYWILVLSGSAFQHHEKVSRGKGRHVHERSVDWGRTVWGTQGYLADTEVPPRETARITHSACKQHDTIIKGFNNCIINGLLCNTVIVTKIQCFASERSWSSQQNLDIPMKPDMGTKISQVFLQVTHMSALGNLA